MEIEGLGPGCARCKATVEAIDHLAEAKGAKIKLTKVEGMREIVSYGGMFTPGVVIGGKVVHGGSVPTAAKIEGWLASA